MSKYHDTLEIPHDADKSAIKKAYRKLASAHHPDKGGAEEKFKEIQEAYDRLSHPEKYASENGFGGGFHHRPPNDEFWKNVKVNINSRDGGFDDLHFRFNEQLRRQQQQVRIQLELELEGTLHDQTRTIHVPEYSIPPTEITIPAGIRHGDVINYANASQDDTGNFKRGFIVQFIIRRHPDFEIVNHVHLIHYLEIDALNAMVGTTLKVKTIDGNTLAVKLPAGSGNGTKLKIPAKGLKYKDNSNVRGDMYINIGISIPALTDEEKEIITKLRDKRQT